MQHVQDQPQYENNLNDSCENLQILLQKVRAEQFYKRNPLKWNFLKSQILLKKWRGSQFYERIHFKIDFWKSQTQLQKKWGEGQFYEKSLKKKKPQKKSKIEIISVKGPHLVVKF